jgi:hypothetical protein
MPRDTRRYLVILALLIVGALAALLITQRESILDRVRSDQGYQFVVDIDNWRRTDRERAVRTTYDFRLGPNLDALPLAVGEWSGQDIPQTNLEVFILLEPDHYVYRRYQRADGDMVWLSLIGSRKSKSFHPPQICYESDGWQTDVSSEPVRLGDGELYALKLVAAKEGTTHVVLYFFIWPDYGRDTAAGTVLFKVTAPLAGSLEETVDLEKAFIRQFFTDAR